MRHMPIPLGSPVSKVVGATQEPFVQAGSEPQMTFGRVALIGDAAFILARTPLHCQSGNALAEALVSTTTTSSKR